MSGPVAGEEIAGYRVCVRRVEVAGRVWELLGPANYESLLDDPRVQARFRADEYMPYWAEFWPANLLLADAVAAWERPTGRVSVLEMGCGLGLVGLVACERGYDVVLSDYDRDALEFVRANARRNGLAAPATRCIDWREPYPDAAFDRILGAEVLYEARSIEPVARFVKAHLKPDGFAVLGDRNRQPADAFPERAAAAGLHVTVRAAQRLDHTGAVVAGRLFHVKHA